MAAPIFKAYAHFDGLTTIQNFPSEAEARAWVAERIAKGCEAVYLGRVSEAVAYLNAVRA